jgi:hypothetical protein
MPAVPEPIRATTMPPADGMISTAQLEHTKRGGLAAQARNLSMDDSVNIIGVLNGYYVQMNEYAQSIHQLVSESTEVGTNNADYERAWVPAAPGFHNYNGLLDFQRSESSS